MTTHKKTVLVIGANRGIGLGIVQNLLQQNKDSMVFASYRSIEKSKELFKLQQHYRDRMQLIQFDAQIEGDYAQLFQQISSHTETLDLCINSIGVLDDQVTFPERKIEEFSIQSMQRAFSINTLPSALLAKSLKTLLKNSEMPKFAAISAKVGSITDNRMGGWYAYRVSKAALNMVIKNLAIEFKRYNANAIFIAVHPGTTHTELSEPFIQHAAKKYTIHSPEETGKNILNVIDQLHPQHDNGCFFSWDGSKILW